MYRQPQPSPSAASPSPHPMYGQPPNAMYPNVSRSHQTVVPPTSRPFPHPPPPTTSSGLGIRVAIKPEYRITPPPQLSPQVGEVPRSNFQFDFSLEKKILAEAEKGNPNWVQFGLENLPPRTLASTPSVSIDPVAAKYIASGLNRDAVTLAVAHYGDNPAKVREFANGYNLLREMGFQSKNVAEVLVMYDNDTDKALAHFLNGTT